MPDYEIKSLVRHEATNPSIDKQEGLLAPNIHKVTSIADLKTRRLVAKNENGNTACSIKN